MSSLISHRIAWDFDAHKAAGKLGGDDFLTYNGEKVEAPVSGWLTMSGSTAVIRQADGWRTVLLELGSLVGVRSREVVRGEEIARAGQMFVHAHDLAPGATSTQHTRSRWITASRPAGGNGSPITVDETSGTTEPRRRRNTMTTLFVNGSTLSGNGAPNPTTVFALAGDSPSTAGNWWEITEETAPGVRPQIERFHGAAVILDSVTFAARRSAYLTPGTAGTGSSDTTRIHPADLAHIDQKIDAIKIPTTVTSTLA